MLLSFRHAFLFIKTPKTAGTSIEVELGKLIEEDAVVTPLYPKEDFHHPRNFQNQRFGIRKGEFTPHMKARDVRSLIGGKRFEGLYKFCVEREPVQKCISYWSMFKNSPHHSSTTSALSWEEYVERGNFPVSTSRWTSTTGAPIVDRILRFETLENGLAEVCKQVGITDWSGLQVTSKSGFREEPNVTAQHRFKIYEAFAQSNFYTGYTIEDSY